MSNARVAKVAGTLMVTAIILLNTVLHTQVFTRRNYREDEINTVHAARILSPPQIVAWMAGDVHPPGWRLFADFWVGQFGSAEAATRWSSQLINLFTFALVYQLGRQLIDRRAACYAVAILGLYGFAANGMAEFRPYAMLIALTTGLHLVFLRWAQGASPSLMVGYAALGMAAIYTHFYALFVFASHAVFLLLFHRFRRKFFLDSLLMWLAIALSFSVWIIPLLAVMLGPFSGGYYEDGLPELYQRMSFRPEVIFGFLSLLCLFAPRLLGRTGITSDGFSPLRLRRHWNLLYPLALLLAALFIAIIANAFYAVLNARGLQILVMLVALLMALGLRLLPAQAGFILIVLLYIFAPQNIAHQPSNGPYREIVAAMRPSYETDSVLVTEFAWSWRWLTPAAYFLMDFTPDHMAKERMFHVIGPQDKGHPPTFPDKLDNIHKSFGAEDFEQLLPAHRQLWLLRQGGGNRWGNDLQDWLNQHYAMIGTKAWDEPYPTAYALSEYRRAPRTEGPMLLAGENMRLYHWRLLDSVDVLPCQDITLESWWQIDKEDERPYTLNIILAEADGDGQLAKTSSVPAEVFTSEWSAGKYYRDQSALQIPCDIQEGSYPLLLGMAETISGEALELRHDSGEVIGGLYYLTTINAQAGQ